MPFIPDPGLPSLDRRRLEVALQLADLAIDIAERLVTENAELKRCLVRERPDVNARRRRQRTRQPA